MMHRTKDQGFEIPVYDESVHVAWSKDEIVDVVASTTEPTFVRRVNLWTKGLGEIGLKATLDIGDEVIEEYAERCGAYVPDHTYGLHSGTPRGLYIPHELVPSGHSLVAETAIVLGLQPLKAADRSHIFEILLSIDEEERVLRWTDAHVDHFMTDQANNIVLHDFEPYISKTAM